MGTAKASVSNEIQRPEVADANGKELWAAVVVLSVAGLMTVLAGIVLFSYHGEAFLERRYDAVGEVLMKEGDRLAEAGLDDRALDRYKKALQARFAGGHNHIYTLKHVGRILLQQGEPAEAVPYLLDAVSGPYADRTAYFFLVDALLRTDQIEEAERHNEAWMAIPETRTIPRENARYLYYVGRIAEVRGEWDRAIRHYEASYEVRPQDHVARRITRLRRRMNSDNITDN